MLHVTDIAKAESNFHRQYGSTLAQWAIIEQRHYHWFEHLIGLSEGMARGVFYSSKSFQGRGAMLRAVAETAAMSDIARAVRKARAYVIFRNAITHGEPKYDFRDGSPTKGQLLLVQGQELTTKVDETAVELDYLAWGHNHLKELARLIMGGLLSCNQNDNASLERCIEQLSGLPSALYPKADTPYLAKT